MLHMQTTNWTRKKLLLFSILVIGAVLVLIEGGFRVWFYFQTKGLHTSLYIQGSSLQMEDSTLIFRNRPFQLDFLSKFQHNEEGMRSAPGAVFMPEKKNNDYWVFLLGASAMEGMGSNKDGEWMDITGRTDYPWNETISFYLEEYLKQHIKDRKVRVFNAANTSYTIEQSRIRYEMLAAKYRIDYMVTMDGQNEPPVLQADQTVFDYLKKDWASRPTKKFPLSWIIPLTQHSAFAYQIKQQSFHRRAAQRLQQNSPRRQFWHDQAFTGFKFKDPDAGMEKALTAYFQSLQDYKHLLLQKGQKGLILLQPHLIFRDSSRMDVTEKAVQHYYGAAYNDPATNSFLRMQRSRWEPYVTGQDPYFATMNWADSATIPVFTDYCHFTPEMNKQVAVFIGEKILASLK